jgi:hypothetical protein
MSSTYGSQQPPPPGQGYYGAQPNNRGAPRRHRPSHDGSASPRASQDHFASQRPSDNFQESYHQPYDPRRYSEAPPPPPEDFEPPNQLAPYDEEKAFAEWNRAYGPESAYASTTAPAPAPAPARRPARRRSLEERRRRYDDDVDSYDDVSVDRRPRPRRHRPRRHDSTHSVSDYQTKPETKDLGPTLMASAAGAFLGRKMVSKGPLGMLGGAIAGAIGANAGEHFDERKRRREQKRNEVRAEEDDRYYREREDDRHRSRRLRAPISGGRDDIRDTETLPPRRRRRDVSRPPRSKRYADSSPDSYVSV